jgi:signal peptidase I
MRKRALVSFVVITIIVITFLSVFFAVSFRTVSVVGASMEPHHPHGTRFLATRSYWLVGAIQPGDVVVFRDPSDPSSYVVKRVYALPGSFVDSAYAPFTWDASRGRFQVPAGHLYVLGDNREESEDSRVFGPIPETSLLGKCVHLWSNNMQLPFAIALTGVVMIICCWLLLRRARTLINRT